MLSGVLAPLAYQAFGNVVPDPRLPSFQQWASDLRLNGFEDAPPFAAEERWREWADYLSSTPAGLQYGVPGALGFATWQEWAERLIQVVG